MQNKKRQLSGQSRERAHEKAHLHHPERSSDENKFLQEPNISQPYVTPSSPTDHPHSESTPDSPTWTSASPSNPTASQPSSTPDEVSRRPCSFVIDEDEVVSLKRTCRRCLLRRPSSRSPARGRTQTGWEGRVSQVIVGTSEVGKVDVKRDQLTFSIVVMSAVNNARHNAQYCCRNVGDSSMYNP